MGILWGFKSGLWISSFVAGSDYERDLVRI